MLGETVVVQPWGTESGRGSQSCAVGTRGPFSPLPEEILQNRGGRGTGGGGGTAWLGPSPAAPGASGREAGVVVQDGVSVPG